MIVPWEVHKKALNEQEQKSEEVRCCGPQQTGRQGKRSGGAGSGRSIQKSQTATKLGQVKSLSTSHVLPCNLSQAI